MMYRNSTYCSLDAADDVDVLLSKRCFDCFSSDSTAGTTPSATNSSSLSCRHAGMGAEWEDKTTRRSERHDC